MLQIVFTLLSLCIVAFGQPIWGGVIGSIAASVGYALFWRVLLYYEKFWSRFWLATIWFACVQFIQMFWMLSHPYSYIYFLYVLFAFGLGIQFGVLGGLITPKNLSRFFSMIAIAALWTIFEWSRLFFFSGYTWNPVGLALTGNLYSLQIASLGGVFLLSFWVILTNLLALRGWWMNSLKMKIAWTCVAILPYAYGVVHVQIHTQAMESQSKQYLKTVLVQTVFLPEEAMGFDDVKSMAVYIIEEWSDILKIIQKQHGKSIDLMVLPEYVVPGGTYSFLFPYEVVRSVFQEVLGPQSIEAFPALNEPLARQVQTLNGPTFMVNNAFWAQAIANYFKTGVLIGLEDAVNNSEGKREYYSAAQYFVSQDEDSTSSIPAQRYEKRVLLPLGEYIPFAFCRALAAEYGVQGSFTPGKEAKVFIANAVPFGLSICYEETFGDLMRENKQAGAKLLVNLTSDVWYPNSQLPRQHFTHALLRTVESGIPLVRASNVGITGAVDSLGRTIKIAGGEISNPEWQAEAIYLDIPIYTYSTLYTSYGDFLIIGLSFLILFGYVFNELLRFYTCNKSL